MPPGPGGQTSGGWFDILEDNAENFPELGTVNKRKRLDNGKPVRKISYAPSATPMGVRYVVLKPSEGAKPIISNPFKLANEINSILKEKVLDVSSMRNGDVLIKCRSADQSKKITQIKTLPISKHSVDIVEHEKLNSSKGKIFRHDFKSMSDEDIKEGLKDQLVTEVKRIQRKSTDGRMQDKFCLFILVCSF